VRIELALVGAIDLKIRNLSAGIVKKALVGAVYLKVRDLSVGLVKKGVCYG
jgi:hypothetical protein